MSAVLLVEASVLLILVCIFVINRFFKLKKHQNASSKPLPPGPWCCPVLGYLPFFFEKKPFKPLTKLANIHGDVYQIKIGSRTLVVINSLDLVKEAFNRWSFSGRPDFPSMKEFAAGQTFHRFVMMTNNAEWKFLRKHALKALGMFAQSKNTRLWAIVREGCASLHADIEQNLGKPFNPKTSMFEVAAAIVGSINFGFQFDRQDPMLQALLEFIDKATILFGHVTDYFNLPNFVTRWRINQQRKVFQPLETIVASHIQNHQCNDDVQDVADALFVKYKEIPESEFEALGIDRMQIRYIAQDLFTAGYVTTQQSLVWFLCLMAKFQDAQTKVGNELLENIGHDRFPALQDSDKTPYTEAAIVEMFRYSSLVPFAIPHSTTEDAELGGFHIPKGCVIMPNFWRINNDEEVYPNPFNFDPSRFLNPDGTLNVDMAQNVTPFSLGKRRCVGENLARQELYLLIASTMVKYAVEPAPGERVDLDDVIEGIVRVVNPCKMVFRRRKFEQI